MKNLPLFAAVAILFFPSFLFAQEGVSSGSVGVARAGFYAIGPNGKYVLPAPEMFRVEEFINYHRHDLPRPTDGKKVLLTGRDLKLENGKTVFEFGLTTPRAIDPELMPPLNIVIVVDESGSMSGAKIQNLKAALNSFVDRFRKTDKLTIVGFEYQARIILESVEKTKINKIKGAINNVHSSGSTNLHAGLMCGYEMALKHFDKERTNRVIFLTDGNANVGVTESEQIARESDKCIKKGISLVTIGLGVDFNHGLLRELADSGRGLMHFVGDEKDIRKTFVNEIDSILAPAARKVKLTLEMKGKPPKIYGYKPEKEGSRYVFKLDDLNHGATQVVMARASSKSKLTGKATLTYVDAITEEKVTQSVEFSNVKNEGEKNSKNDKSKKESKRSVKRNYAIALLADALHSAAKDSNDGNNSKAEKRLVKAIGKSKEVCSNRDDKHVNRVLEIANKYCKLIAQN